MKKACNSRLLIVLLAAVSFLGANSAAAQPPDLVSWWPGDKDAMDVQGDNDGVLMNGAQAGVPGLVGGAFSFDGEDDFVLIPDSASLNITDQISIDVWVLPTDVSGGQDIIAKDGEVSDRQYILSIGALPPHRFRPHLGLTSGFVFFDGNTVVQTGRWYYLAMTYDGSSLRLYVNGELDESLNATGIIFPTLEPLRIGGGAPAGSPPFHFAGLVDEARLFSRALTPDEIEAEYSMVVQIFADGFESGDTSAWSAVAP